MLFVRISREFHDTLGWVGRFDYFEESVALSNLL